MKKLLSLVLLTTFGLGATAQDKKFQLGLVLGPTFNWTKIQTTKIERQGIGNGFTIGIGGNYMFNENVGFASGIQFDLESFKINYGSDSDTALGVFFMLIKTQTSKNMMTRRLAWMISPIQLLLCYKRENLERNM